MDWTFLQRLSDAPSVATACEPVLTLVSDWLGGGVARRNGQDSFALFTLAGASLADLRCLMIAHVDEIGGCVLSDDKKGWYRTRCWGCSPMLYAQSKLQGMDYLASAPDSVFPIEGGLDIVGGELRLRVRGSGIRPYRTVFTFHTRSTIEGDHISGKALDPRATVFAVLSAFRSLNHPAVGVLLVMAEECFMDAARKAVVHLQRHAPGLRVLVNADVPSVANLDDAKLEVPAIRPFEGRNIVDPGFSIRLSDQLAADGVIHQLSAARSGSQTALFAPLAPTVSVALPGDRIHTECARMSLTGISRCTDLLAALGGYALTEH